MALSVLLAIAIIGVGSTGYDTGEKLLKVRDASNNFRKAKCIGKISQTCPLKELERHTEKDKVIKKLLDKSKDKAEKILYENKKEELKNNLREAERKKGKSPNKKNKKNVKKYNRLIKDINKAKKNFKIFKILKENPFEMKLLKYIKNISGLILKGLTTSLELAAPYEDGGIPHPILHFYEGVNKTTKSQNRLEKLKNISNEDELTPEQSEFINHEINEEKKILFQSQHELEGLYREALPSVHLSPQEKLSLDEEIRSFSEKSYSLINDAGVSSGVSKDFIYKGLP